MTDRVPVPRSLDRSRRRTRHAGSTAAAIAVIGMLALAAGGCGGSGAQRADRSSPSAETAEPAARAGDAGSAVGVGAATDSTGQAQAPSGGSQQTPAVGPKIVKTGSIEMEVRRDGFSQAVGRLTSLATGMNGFVAQSQTSELGDAPAGTVTIRVPVDRFEELVLQVRRLGKVRSATTGGRDVTGEYTDLVGRLKTFTNERDQLLVVLTDANGIPDILAVRDRINTVQAEIEQLQGRRNVLDDQTSLSTLTVALHEPGATTAGPSSPRSGLSGAWHRAVDRFVGGVEAIVAGSGTVALLAICGLAGWLVARPLWRRFNRPAAAPVRAAPEAPA